MRNIPAILQERLHQTFDGRASFDQMERRIYSHDVGELPLLIKPLIGNTTAAGVVQPHDEDELVELVKLANEQQIPLVPRGKATSGYGGVLPVQGGLVVDFYRLRKMVAIDAEQMTVTVEPGIVWRDLEHQLGEAGLALRLYPSSAPSSTVGGWLAQGGYGYGSYEYGPFRDSVVSARVVLPTGEVREFSGAELDLVSDAEGITGLISRVTLRVRPLEDEVVVGARFDRAEDLAAAVQQIAGDKLPLWSASFINPTMARLKNQAPAKLEHGQPNHDEHAPQLPEAYLAVFVFPAGRAGAVEEPLKRILAAHNGALLSEELAHHEWDERFSIMKIKRLGPSMVPAEVIVPLKNLGPALAEIERIIKQPLAIEGMALRGDEVLFLGFIPHDARSLLYNMAFGLSLSVIKLAKRHGGRAYASGLYFAREAENILGADRLRRLREFKAQTDRQGIMNPGKVLSPGLMGAFMGLAEVFEPLGRPFFNLAKAPIGERPRGAGKRGIPDDVAWYAYACAQCGYCVDGCDQFYGRGWESQSPRGKWFFLREYMAGHVKMPQEQVDTFLACTTCEICNVECPLNLPIEPAWLKLRGKLVHDEGRMTFPPFEIMAASLRKEHNIWGAYRKDRADWAKVGIDSIPEQAEICYFPGCTASYVEQDIAQSTACLLRKAGVEFTYLGDDEACCGIPMLVAGLWDTWEEIMRHNIAAMKKRGVKTVVTTCPACWLVWKQYYPEWAAKLGIDYPFEAKHYSEILAERIQSGDLVFDQPIDMRVTWHDSCHMGRAGGIYEPPREVLQAIPGLEFVEMEHNREHAHCCGSVLSLVADPPVAARIGDVRLREAEAVNAEAVISTCPCCQVQLRVTAEKTGRDMPIMDLGSLACQAASIPHPDSTAYALEQWATFEAMINLLKPEPMADLMVELFPQMFAAMPSPMVPMMKVARRVPGMLALMKPMMPLMMPMLMPSIMPQVMPDMLVAVDQRVPMPEYMREQMPDLMPAAMDNLLPKMLPLVMPYLVPPMMDYIQNEL
ncbi:MAG: FAD-binding oxidoreductase [Chloroflexi bacterium]|nr:FAD-binding oxidoreductase [Chloroflexota bacterium]